MRIQLIIGIYFKPNSLWGIGLLLKSHGRIFYLSFNSEGLAFVDNGD